jgi:hypothetical protein
MKIYCAKVSRSSFSNELNKAKDETLPVSFRVFFSAALLRNFINFDSLCLLNPHAKESSPKKYEALPGLSVTCLPTRVGDESDLDDDVCLLS